MTPHDTAAGKSGTPILETTLADAWSHLERGVQRASEAFHLGVFGSWNGRECGLRTVVLRGVNRERRELICHTDYRSPKRVQVDQRPRVSWLFYDPDRKLQLRMMGQAQTLREGTVANARWGQTSLSARRCYLAGQAPGTPVASPASGLAPPFEARPPSHAESAQGRANFVVILTVVDELDWLQLDARGHRRARFR